MSLKNLYDLFKNKIPQRIEDKQFYTRHGSGYLLNVIIYLTGKTNDEAKQYLAYTSTTTQLHTVLTGKII